MASNSSSKNSFTETTISMSAGRLILTMAAVAISVFLTTAHFYAGRSEPAYFGVEREAPSSKMVPLESMPNHTSRTVLIKRDASKLSHKSSTGKQVTYASSPDEEKGINIKVGNVASEVGIVIALQAIFPVVNRLVLVAKRIKWASLGVRVSPALGRMLKTFGDVWHSIMLLYKKTSASKIVTRTKKMVKIFKHHDDDHDEHDDHHGQTNGHKKKDKHAGHK